MLTYALPVTAPYRLDLTVSALRRLSTNVVDLLTPDGVYVRALPGVDEPVVVRVSQNAKARDLSVAIAGDARDDESVLALVGQMLGSPQPLVAAESTVQPRDVPGSNGEWQEVHGVVPAPL